MPEVIVFVGIQATGKSTYYSRQFGSTHIRINLDMLRTRRRERILVSACIEAQQSFVVDNTNPTQMDRLRYLEPALAANFVAVGYYFQSRLRDAQIRNASRAPEWVVPEVGLRATSAKLERPSYDEGFTKLYYVSINAEGEFVRKEWEDEV